MGGEMTITDPSGSGGDDSGDDSSDDPPGDDGY
jgi:hypothetical protein